MDRYNCTIGWSHLWTSESHVPSIAGGTKYSPQRTSNPPVPSFEAAVKRDMAASQALQLPVSEVTAVFTDHSRPRPHIIAAE
jgi:hypothetical protein